MHRSQHAIPHWARVVLPVIGISAFLIGWQLISSLGIADPELLPAPTEIAVTLWTWILSGGFFRHFLATLYGTLGGLILGASLGFIAGLVVAELGFLERSVYPMVLALQAMPVVAIAPLVIVWFGIGLASKVALVAIGTFFVMFINTVAGMHSAPRELIDMCRAFGGNRWRIVWEVKINHSMNYVFSGLEICAALSFILCVVGEFIAAQNGLGYFIKAASSNINTSGMFAAVAVLALLASLLAVTVRAVHRRVVFWENRKT